MIPRQLYDSDHEMFRDSVRKFLETEAMPHHETVSYTHLRAHET